MLIIFTFPLLKSELKDPFWLWVKKFYQFSVFYGEYMSTPINERYKKFK